MQPCSVWRSYTGYASSRSRLALSGNGRHVYSGAFWHSPGCRQSAPEVCRSGFDSTTRVKWSWGPTSGPEKVGPRLDPSQRSST
ncbi:hypothetical protein BV20DRAFT_146112 [Pilatotrama ljubarskyi]|nr:hypothetical protein BV20DRAFT_146112 [Pilatotrama ljubarskyi]